MRLRPIVPLVALATALAGGAAVAQSPAPSAPAPATAASTPAGDAKHGSELFAINCSACHGGDGGGGVGPSLQNEKRHKNMAQLIDWIKKPDPPMPKLYPGTLSEKDVRDVAAFVLTL